MTVSAVPKRPRRLAAGAAYAAVLLPVALFALVATACGRPRSAARTWFRLRTGLLGRPPLPEAPRPGAVAVATHALLSALLGAVALIPLGMMVAFVARGVFYGLVDHGPYDHSWGGPTRAGAWLAHFLISLPAAAASVLVLAGLAALHQRLTQGLAGHRQSPGLILLAVVIPLPAAAFFVAWLRQI